MKPRYLIRCSGTGRLLAWSYDESKAKACAAGMCSRLIACYLEIAS